MPQYISAETTERSLDTVCLFRSYPEAELHGFDSLKRLKELDLSVQDSGAPARQVGGRNQIRSVPGLLKRTMWQFARKSSGGIDP